MKHTEKDKRLTDCIKEVILKSNPRQNKKPGMEMPHSDKGPQPFS
jgi:hypothetical protein